MGLLGAHMSIAGGLHHVWERGDELGCEAIQIFVQSSRTWAIPPLKKEDVSAFQEARKKAKKVKRIVAHNSYLLNLTTANEELREKSVGYFIETMERCEALGIESLITHPGSHLGAGVDLGLKMTAKSVDEVLGATRGFKTKLVLENTAGQGDCVGCDFSHLKQIVDQTKEPDRVFFCFDTQHAFAAGYDLRTPETYEATMQKWDELLSLKKIVAFHVNDAKKELGCRVDRHQNIGKGFLGKNAFRPLVNDNRFKNIPMCLETAPGDENENWKRELKLLRSLVVKTR